MSGGVNITSGGAISVDSEAFRGIGERLETLSWELVRALDIVRRTQHVLESVSEPSLRIRLAELASREHRLEVHAGDAGKAATGTLLMADVFELVELRAQQEALGVGESAEEKVLQDRIDALIASYPDVEMRADQLVAAWEGGRFEGLTDQSWDDALAAVGVLGAVVSPAFYIFLTPWLTSRPVGSTMGFLRDLALKSDRGLLPAGTRLQGDPPPVNVSMVRSEPVAPAAGLKDMMTRVPYESTGQVAVEKYTMKDGSTRFVAYIDGTREMKPGTKEPWDSVSDWEMYMERRDAASHEATLQAIAAAGARPGDKVDLVGYSQGAMIASHVAMDSPYKVGTVIVAGDPVDPALAPDQTLIRLENGADPVNGLALGGAAGGTGSPDSFTIERDGTRESPIDPHLYGPYVETASQADASQDPRMRALRERYFAELGEAVSVEQMEFSAERP
ncbi:hypothetical protein MIAR_34210 [Microbacterium arabinogalactanolyticum]|nr:hypothetical protein MIAR_34210 [Microbacterium arabinogalactanolyticum]